MKKSCIFSIVAVKNQYTDHAVFTM